MTRAKGGKRQGRVKAAAARHKAWDAIVQAFGRKPALLHNLGLAILPEPRRCVVQGLTQLAHEHFQDHKVPADLFSEFIKHCVQNCVPPIVGSKVHMFQTARNAYMAHRKRIVDNCNLNHAAVSDEDRKAWLLENCEVVEVEKLQQHYPPYAHWVCESQEIMDLWQMHCEEGKLHDRRTGRFPLCLLDHSKLQHVARHDRSVLYVDSDGELVAFVMRDWCPEVGITKSIVDTVLEARGYKKSVRVRHLLLLYQDIL